MDSADAAREFVELFAEVYHHCYPRVSPREPQVSGESLALLRHLEGSGPLTVQEAAAHFDRSQAATSEMIERLVARGLLERMADQRDRRRHLVWLTDAALALLDEARRPLSDALLRNALDRMEPAARATLIESMRLLVQAAGAGARHHHKGDPS